MKFFLPPIAWFLLSACAGRLPGPSKASLERFPLEDRPELGAFHGKKIRLGGLSGLCLTDSAPGRLRFLTHTDRGPNPEPVAVKGKKVRPFLLPRLQPRLVTLELRGGTLSRLAEAGITGETGTALSGLPPGKTPMPAGFAAEPAVDGDLKPLAFDRTGLDLEGIACAATGNLWMVEEYGPSLLEVTREGKVLNRYIPEGAGRAGFAGIEALPARLGGHRLNRGFEGVALDAGKAYLFLQSPYAEKSRSLVVYEFDLALRKTVGEYEYSLEPGPSDKIGDAAALGGKKFLVLEQDSKSGPGSFHRIFELDLNGVPRKRLVADLVDLGYDFAEKVEGLAVVDRSTLAVLNDDDFGVRSDSPTDPSGARIDPESPIVLGLIHLPEPL